jgi:hypothetical protein
MREILLASLTSHDVTHTGVLLLESRMRSMSAHRACQLETAAREPGERRERGRGI